MLQISYEPLWETLRERDMKKLELKEILSPAAMKKLQNVEPVSLNVLMKICGFLDVSIEKVVQFKKV